MAGQVQLMFLNQDAVIAPSAAGKVVPLAISSAQRNPLLPQVPTVEEAGVPRFESATKFALFAPAGTPPAVIDRLYEAVRSVQKNDELKDRLRQQGIELVAASPAELRKDAADDLAKWGRLISERKLSLD